MRIGIIGRGFVGSAVEYCFSCDSKFQTNIFSVSIKLRSFCLPLQHVSLPEISGLFQRNEIGPLNKYSYKYQHLFFRRKAKS